MCDYTWGYGPGSPYEDNKYLFEENGTEIQNPKDNNTEDGEVLKHESK